MLSQKAMNPEVIITNLKKRYSGVSGTINALLPVQAGQWRIALVGTDLPGASIAKEQFPNNFQHISLWRAIWLSRKSLPNQQARIWHVRRDPEMLLAIMLRDLLRFPIKIVFTSAAKHQHSWFPRWMISKMDAVIATTLEAAALVPNTTAIVPHGISLERFTPPEDKLSIWHRTGLPGKYGIGTFGRIRPEKGCDIFVDAMIKLLPDFPEWTAVLAGLCTPEYEEFEKILKNKIAAARLDTRIVFLGVIPSEDIADWYQNVLITVTCPRYEGFGLTVLEAMACGCAVVATNTGAFKDMVEEGETGYIVRTNSSVEIENNLRSVMQDTSKAKLMGEKGRTKVEKKFSVSNEARSINKVYQDLQILTLK